MKKLKHKYLDKIGIGNNRPDLWNKDDIRQKEWKKMRKKYGFDERETWSLDYTWHLWLYERIKAFKDWACIDLDYHKFIYKDKEYTQGQLIDMIIDRLEIELDAKNDAWNLDNQQQESVNEIEDIWALICHSMWW